MSDNYLTNNINESITKINTCLKNISENYYEIAECLYNLKMNEAIEITNFKGYKNISEFAEGEFGISKSKAYDLIAIYDKFLIGAGDVYKNYKYSQLREMLSMDMEKIELCNENMTIKEIKLIKYDFSTRVEKESIENTDLIKNNNVIEGVFPENKTEEEPEEKVTTIIVTELPREPIRENKTITVNVKTEQNDDFVANQEHDSVVQDDYYKKKYHGALEEIETLQSNIGNSNKQIENYKNKCQELQDVIKYFHKEVFNLALNSNNKKLLNLSEEFGEFVVNQKLPEKLYFMNKVI